MLLIVVRVMPVVALLVGCASVQAPVDPAYEARVQKEGGDRRWIGYWLSQCVRSQITPFTAKANCWDKAKAWCIANGYHRLCAEDDLLIDPDALTAYPLHGNH